MATDTQSTTPENDNLRDSLDAAFEKHATDEVDPTPATPVEGEQAAAAERARDQRGRFAAKDEGQDATQPTGKAPGGPQERTQQAPQGQPTTVPAAPPPGGELKAPASWKPEVREKWAGVDPTIKAEVHRREYEMQQVLQQSAGARQFIDAFERVVQPYEMFIRAENSNPLQAVQNLMQTAAELRVGTPMSKAQLVAGIIKNFSVDVATLDSLLAGTVPQGGGAQQQQEFRDPRFDQFLAQQQQMLAQQQQREDQELRQGLAAFGEKHEFYRDVAGVMADLVEIRSRQGQTVDLEKVYEQACKMHEGVSTILATRAATTKNGAQSQAVLRAKRAAASVKGESTLDEGATIPKNDSVRASIEAAIDTLGNT
jgi:hypothetical protein